MQARAIEPRNGAYIFIACKNPAAISKPASPVWCEQYARPARSRARRDLWLLGQPLDAGANAHGGELLSYSTRSPFGP